MIKLLIVDDESAARKGLIKHIPWNELGVHLVEEAKDGFDALEIANQFHPDIILSDIRMPGIDGIELATKIREKLPHCRIIFFSAYSDKEYLKAAIHLGVISYVEKPINLTEVKDVIRKAVTMCKEDREKELSDKNISVALNESLPYIKQSIVTNLINEKKDFEEVFRELHIANIPFNMKDQFNVMILKLYIDTIQGSETNDLNQIVNLLDEYLHDIKHICASIDSSHIIVILSYDTVENRTRLTEIFESISCTIDVNLFCAVGKNVLGMGKIPESYNAAKLTLQESFLGYNRIVFYENDSIEPLFFDKDIYNTFQEYLKGEKEKEAIALIENLCNEIKKSENPFIDEIKNVFFELTLIMFKEAEQRNIDLGEKGYGGKKYLWSLISAFQTLNEIRDYLINKVTILFKNIEQSQTIDRQVSEAVKYIQKNYSDPNLSIKTLADFVYLTPNYLSALFKKEMGITISEYITEVRIQESKDLLIESKVKLYEVARNVGYRNPNYYSKAFKKLVGWTPSEFRKKY